MVKRGTLGWLLGWLKRGSFRVVIRMVKRGSLACLFGWLKRGSYGWLLGWLKGAV